MCTARFCARAVSSILVAIAWLAPGAAAQVVPHAGSDQTILFPAQAALTGELDNRSPLSWWTADGNHATENAIVMYSSDTGYSSSPKLLSTTGLVFGWPSDLIWINGSLHGIESYLRYLYTVVPETGVCTAIGPANTWHDVYCLAYDQANDKLYGVDLLKKQLLLFNRTTGVVTRVGQNTLVGWPLIRALAYRDSDQKLYAVDQQSDKLLRIDPITGVPTPILQLPVDPVSRIEELSFFQGELYASHGLQDTMGTLLSGELQHIDLVTGVVTTIGPGMPDCSPHSLIVNSLPEDFLWTKTAGPGTATFSDAHALTPTVTFSVPGTYELTLTAFAYPTPVADAVLIHVDLDTDGDGVPDSADGCPLDPLKIAPGQCGCGVPDTDSDGDGVANCIDGCPDDANKIAPGACGCGVADTDTDNDGTPDCIDGCPEDPLKIAAGVCGCGVADTDTDSDGTPDCIDGCPLDPNKIDPGVCGCGVLDIDTDNDGTPDCHDGCPLDPSKIAAGACGCGVPDIDTDNDGTPDCIDGCPSDPTKIAAGACGCGVPDTDTDEDGVADCIDNCPSTANATQDDADFDGVGDACDNCPAHANAGQADCDGNGIGDVCEIALGLQPDCDANGIPDNCDPDCNHNGVADACDLAHGTSLDINSNGVPDECELSGGIAFCFGDGSGTPCPCGNSGAPGEGCANSAGHGSKMYNSGGVSASLNDTVLVGIQLPPNKSGIFFTGFEQQNGGLGITFGDGLLCLKSKRRFPGQVSSAGGVVSFAGPVGQSNGQISAGSTWYFQAWHRDSATGPCGQKTNLSNALEITFAP